MQVLKFFLVIRVLAVSLVLSSCGALNDMKEMHDATLKMSQTTEEMNKNTQEMLKTTHEMLEQTTKMGGTTEEMARKHGVMIETMNGMDQKMGSMIGEVKTTNASMDEMKNEVKKSNESIGLMHDEIKKTNATTSKMDEKMGVMTEEVKQTNASMTVLKGILIDTNALMKDLALDMKSMVGKIDVMKNLTDRMYKALLKQFGLTQNMYEDMQMAYSSDGRRDLLAGLDKAKDLNSKCGWAGMYMMAFDFQYWKPGVQSNDDRQIMFKNAVMEILSVAQDYTNGVFLLPRQSQSDLSFYDVVYSAALPAELVGKRQSLFALVATMHLINDAQSRYFKGDFAKLKPVSLYTLLREGLRAKAKVQNGSKAFNTIPQYQQKVLEKEQMAVFLVQLRQSFLRAAVYDLIAQEKSGNSLSPAYSWIKSKIGKRWSPNFSARNVEQIQMAAEYLELSQQTVNDLTSMGITPVREKIIDDLYHNMDLKGFAMGSTPEGTAIKRFTDAVNAAYPNRKYK